MINTLKRNLFPGLIALSALSVSASAAFYSVYGLSKLFAGASLEVIIMAGSLEVAKLVTASLRQKKGDELNKIGITERGGEATIVGWSHSRGIYVMVREPDQETYYKLSVGQNQKLRRQPTQSFSQH